MATCDTCKHFDNRKRGGSIGECRVNPPQLARDTFMGTWPVVSGGFDYCAQYSPKGSSVHGPGEWCSLCRQSYPEHPSMVEATR